MRRMTEFEYMYRILKEIRTKWLSTNRVFTYSNIGSTPGSLVLQKLERLGLVQSLIEGHKTFWKATITGASVLSEMISIYQQLELLCYS